MKRKRISGKLLKIGFAAALSLSVITPTALAKEQQSNPSSNRERAGELVDTPLGPKFQFYDQTRLQSQKMYYRNNLALPAKYDLRDTGRVTSVKDQGVTGACWTFGALAALESSMIVQGNADTSIDLSERQLAYYNYYGQDNSSDKSLYAGKDTYAWRMSWNDLIRDAYYLNFEAILDEQGINKDDFAMYSIGGNAYMASATLARQYGAVTEDKAPYEELYEIVGLMGAPEASVRTQSDVQLDSTRYLSPTYIENDKQEYVYQPLATEEMKQALKDNGIVNISYFADQSTMSETTKNGDFFNYTTWAQNVDDITKIPNHSVAIVGWDDTYSKDNFVEGHKPAGDGAWIVKNSWGSLWGLDGYFYLSYYDKSICDATTFIAQPSAVGQKKYDNIYQYDGVGFGDTVYQGGYDSPVYGANIFTARENELLEAVGITLPAANTFITVDVYTGWDGDDITSGDLKSSIRTKVDNAGYVTLPLKDKVNLSKGTKYVI